MNEHRQEQAAAYVLGALPEDERVEFDRALAADPELQTLVRELDGGVGELARSLPETPPPARVKAAILSRISATVPTPQPGRPLRSAPRVEPAPARRSPVLSILPWLGWAAAAGLAVMLSSASSERERLAGQLGIAQQRGDELAATASTAQATADELARAASTAKSAADEVAANLAAATTERVRLEGSAVRLQQALETAQTQLAEATQAGNLARLQVAHLASLVQDQPQAMAVSLWNSRTQQGVLVVRNLPLPPAGKTYEFWVIDPATAAPVSAGLLLTDSEGRAQLVFKPKANIATASQFAISIEPSGGSTQAGPSGPVVMAGATTQL